MSANETLTGQSHALVRGESTAVSLAKVALKRANVNQSLNAFVALDQEMVLEQARAADLRRENKMPLGPLDGLPIAVKDNYLTKDYPTTACSHARPLESVGVDATIVANLRAAGAVIFGKTNMHEWAYGATNTTSCFGATYNPYDKEHITGGSSGGSGAAVSAGIVHGALGSDTGGSVRIPASACGVYGFKPTYGRASRHGILPLSWSLDTPGTITASLEDIELMLPYFFGQDGKDPATSQAKTFKPETRFCQESFRLLSLTGVGLERTQEVDMAVSEALERVKIVRKDVELKNIKSYFASWETILHCEASAYFQPLIHRNLTKFSPVTQSHLKTGTMLTGIELLTAQKLRAIFIKTLLHGIGKWDVLVLPTLPVTAPRQDENWQEFGDIRVSTQDSMTWFCWLGNLAGLPSLTIPISLSKNGLPIGMMFMGRPGQDEKLLAIAKNLEKRGLKEGR